LDFRKRHLQFPALCENHRTLHKVFQLTDIARPAIAG
jgi:hypothetical protein